MQDHGIRRCCIPTDRIQARSCPEKVTAAVERLTAETYVCGHVLYGRVPANRVWECGVRSIDHGQI